MQHKRETAQVNQSKQSDAQAESWECGTCFKGKSDMGHTCRTCGGTGNIRVVADKQASIATAIQYPEEWDVMAYPTLESALHELAAWQREAVRIDSIRNAQAEQKADEREALRQAVAILGKTKRSPDQQEALDVLIAALSQSTQSISDPMDWPIPAHVKLGTSGCPTVVIGKGCTLRQVEAEANNLIRSYRNALEALRDSAGDPVAWACWMDGVPQTAKNMQLSGYEPLSYPIRRALVFAAQPAQQEPASPAQALTNSDSKDEKKYCSLCNGSGSIETGIAEWSSTQCKACDGTGMQGSAP